MNAEELNQYVNQNLWIIINIVIWDLIWKGVALWKAAKNDSRGWFITLLVLNTVGLLPILYIYVFGKEKQAN